MPTFSARVVRRSWRYSVVGQFEVWLQRKEQRMIFGAHVIVYSKDATADRAFLREVLGLSSVTPATDG